MSLPHKEEIPRDSKHMLLDLLGDDTHEGPGIVLVEDTGVENICV
jgi:hypothetical protein